MPCHPIHRGALAALLVPAILTACGGGTRQAESGPGEQLAVTDFKPDQGREPVDEAALDEKVVRPDELPQAHRDLLDAWRIGGFTWEVHRGEVLSDPALTTFLVENLLAVIFQEHNAISGAAHGAVTGEALAARRSAYARARAELPLLGEPAAVALAEVMALADDVLFALVRDILDDMGPDGAPAVAGLLDRERALTRYRAALVLGRLPSGGLREAEVHEALVAASASDGSEIVRVQATRSVGERALWSMTGRDLTEVDLTPSRLALEERLQDGAEAVRLEALAGLSLLGDVGALPALVAFGQDARRDERLKELSRAARTVATLAGRDLGADPGAWRSWWESGGTPVEGS